MDKKKVRRQKVGELAIKAAKNTSNTSAIEQMREQLTDYDENIYLCVKNGKAELSGDFYVVVLTKKERIMKNVIRNYFFFRLTCPTPDYDQVVYKYTRNDDGLEFMWVIPAVDIVYLMSENSYKVKPDKYRLLEYVLKFVDGSLLRLSKKLNNEMAYSNILDN